MMNEPQNYSYMNMVGFKSYLIFFIIAFIFCLLLSSSTSLLGPLPALDSSIFQVIGKYWAEGIVPYVGLWDNKGPIIFFINAVGYYIFQSYVGVFLIQVFCLSITFFFVFQFFKGYFSSKRSWLLSIVFVVGLANCYEVGNSVEEYLLPFLVPCLLYMYKWTDSAFIKKEYDHSYKYAFFYGIILAFSLLTRLTNAIGICVGTMLIVIILIKTGKWRNVLFCSLSFICGFCILTIPFVLYFYSKGALYEMWYGSFLFNIEYVGKSSSIGFSSSLYSFISHILSYSSSLFLIVVSLIVIIFNKERRLIGYFWLVVSIVTYLYFYNTYRYSHYSIIAIVYICIGIVELYKIIGMSFSSRKSIKYFLHFFSLLLLLGCSYQIYQVLESRILSKDYLVDYKELLAKIPLEEQNSFVGYNTEAYYYLALNIRPYYRFFCIQDWAASNGDSLSPIIRETFEEGDVKWILVKTYGGDSGVQDILNRRYLLYDKKNDLLLYRLK